MSYNSNDIELEYKLCLKGKRKSNARTSMNVSPLAWWSRLSIMQHKFFGLLGGGLDGVQINLAYFGVEGGTCVWLFLSFLLDVMLKTYS